MEVVYGSTEAEPISSIDVKYLVESNPDILEQGLNVGKPNKCAQVKIIVIKDEILSVQNEAELKTMELPLKTIGEIIVSGNHVLREYFNNDEALKRNKIFIGEKCWHRTGDSGYFDANGILFLTGRCNTLININEKTISPFIYENYFQTIEGVEMGTIMMLERKLTAIIELKDNSAENTVWNKINTLEIKFEKIIFINKIPRDPRHNSKIDYAMLTKQIK